MGFITESDAEKSTSNTIEKIDPASITPEYSHATERKTLLKLDLLLMPMMCGIYLLSFLDKSNIGNARVAGLQKDLGLTDLQYQTAICITYVPYILAELPSNLVLKKIGPRILLPALCVAWGTVTTLQSLIFNFSGLLACRFFLGMFEGGLFPGIVLYLSSFYRPHELQIRVGLFFSAAALSGAFSGLLAAGIQQMNGIANLHGWQWIFLIEGIVSVVFGILAFFILPNLPKDLKTFTPEQRQCCEDRLKRDISSTENHKISGKAVLSTFKDLDIWLLSLILFCNGASLFGLSYFSPSIVAALGFNATQTQLLTVPPYVLAFFVTMIAAYCADKYKRRGITSLITTTLALIGIILFYIGRDITSRYVSLCFLITGIYASAPSFISWVPNNLAAHSRRATGIAMAFISTNIGGIMSTWIYPSSSGPYFVFGAQFNLALICITLGLTVAKIAWLMRLNRRKVTHRDQLLSGIEHLTVAEQFEILGDHHPDFLYTL